MMQIFTIYNDEQPILEQIAQGKKLGLEWVYKNCFITTKKMVIKLGGDEDEAWDVFQDAVTILYEKCIGGNLELNCRINTYITAIAKNLWGTRFKSKINITNPEEWEETASAELDVNVFIEQERNFDFLKEALEELGEPCSKMLQAFYFHKKSMQDICTDFGYTNADNAKTQKYKCLNRLKKIFFNKTASNSQQNIKEHE
jgi:RNA polymerase sigma factor (sigma-70 family)